MTASTQRGDQVGPFFEELEVGQRIERAPALTLTPGHAVLHQAIVARLRLSLDAGLSADVIGVSAPLAHPALVWDVAIGQSTLVTRRVIANLFYRGLVFRRAPVIGATLRTTTEVVALRQNVRKPGRPGTGMAVLTVRTVDQARRPVLDFWRCAMLPLADPDGETGAADDLDPFFADLDPASLDAAISDWRLRAYRTAVVGGQRFEDLAEGDTWAVQGGDVVSSAPELARRTLNVATAHHDATGNGRRLVYGGHTIGIGASRLTRVLPDLVTIVAWHGCDHLAPVLEGDTLTSEIEVERCQPLPYGGGLVHPRSRVQVHRGSDGESHPVLDWRLVGMMA